MNREIEELKRKVKALEEDMEIIKGLLRQSNLRFHDELSY